MGLLTPQRPTRQPQSALRIDHSNPIARGLVFASFDRFDAASNSNAAIYGSTTPAAQAAMRGISTTDMVSGMQFAAAPALYAITTDITVITFAAVSSYGSYSSLVCVPYYPGGWAAPYGSVGIQANAGGPAIRLWGGSMDVVGSAATGLLTDGAVHMYAAAKDSVSGIVMRDATIENGTIANLPASTPFDWNTKNPVNILCRNKNDTGEGIAGKSFISLIFNRRLSNAELLSIYRNPYQLLAPSQRRLLFDVPAGGASSYSYTAAGGFVLSGAATRVRGAARLASGGLSTGGTASASRSTQRSASGGITFAGAAIQAKGRAIAAAGGFVLAGASTMRRGVARAAAGGLAFAGQAGVSFFSSVQSRIVTPVGGFVLAGGALVARGVRKAASGGISFAGRAGTTFFPPVVVTYLNGILPIFVRRRRRK